MPATHARWCLIGLAALAGCGGGTEPSSLPAAPVRLELVSGDRQLVAPGDTTALPLAVRALDSAGRSVPQVEVTFTVRIGRGTLVEGTTGRTISVRTSTEGVAEARWVASGLGEVPDSTYVDATVASLTPVEFLLRIGFPAPPAGHSIAAAANFTCRITNPLYCWGTLQDGLPPTLYTGARPVTVDGYGGTMCAAVAHGRYCWGDNSLGQYGDGLAESYPAPHAIQDGLQFTSLAVGGQLACGLDLDAVLWCWSKVQTLLLTSPAYPTGYPQMVAAGIHRIDAGEDFMCAVSVRYTIHCIGKNAFGQLGVLGPDAWQSSLDDAIFVEVATGTHHACALDEGGTAWCWGRNDAGQVGDGSLSDRSVPLRVAGGLSFAGLAAGDRHTCALEADGSAWCWGSNAHGQLGNESVDDSAVPVAVAGTRRFSELAAGAGHTCGISTDGATVCWGAAQLGQIPPDPGGS